MEYLNFRHHLLKEFEARRCKNPSYSKRAFARDIELSAGYLSQILKGQKTLSEIKAERISERLKWSKRQTRLFRYLLRFDLAKTKQAKDDVYREINDLNLLPKKFRLLAHDEFRIVSDWYHFAIFELIGVHPRIGVQLTAKRLQISEQLVRLALLRLQRVKLIERTPDGFRKLMQECRVGPISSQAIRQFHDQHLRRAQRALIEQDTEMRNFCGRTFAIDPKKLPEAKQAMLEFREKMSKLLYSSSSEGAVYHLGMQLYRLDDGDET